MKIALLGNPNSGKTTVFNDLTGSEQYVGNWPGVTVEKKEGRLLLNKDVLVADLPGIYSLSPYTLEEVITRDYLIEEKPDVVINIVDASNLERNLYLTTQVVETGLPLVIALNMMDRLEKEGIEVNSKKLSDLFNCPVVETSAVRSEGMNELINVAMNQVKPSQELRIYDEKIEASISLVEEFEEIKEKDERRYLAIKLLEDDDLVAGKIELSEENSNRLQDIRKCLEEIYDDDIEALVANGRHKFILGNIDLIQKKEVEREGLSTTSDKIDKVLTNKYLAFPIFLGIMWLIYYISISTVGDISIGYVENLFGYFGEATGNFLSRIGASEPVTALVVEGIIGGVGSVFTFVPQMMILFMFLAFMEDSGYMSRVAFIMDRLFRQFGLSGKSFIPMLIGTGCSIPGVLAARTIENEADRKMTILLTPFVPCGAKLPVFAMFIAIVFGGAAWVGPFIYLFSIIVILISGLILKRTKEFSSDTSPFIMEMPAYKLPTIKGTGLNMLEKVKSFIKRAGSLILVANLLLWFLQNFNLSLQYIPDNIEDSILAGIGGALSWIFKPLGFGGSWAPAVATITGLVAKEVIVSTFMMVGATSPIEFTQVSAFAFIIFTMFAPPCFAAIGAMKKELGSGKNLLKALGFHFGVAYVLSFIVNQVGSIIFKGTPAMEKILIEPSLIAKAGEFSEPPAFAENLLAYAFIGLLLISLVFGIIATIERKNKYRKVKK
ncbi:MAG: ferrous iron transport protein B [Tissierellia bacterium]|nr:ferrous iron transport protein B [Tissierellia bacterium]